MKRVVLIIVISGLFTLTVQAQVEYPAPVYFFSMQVENKNVRMAYMDIRPANPGGKTIVLLHGKNFNGYYWKDILPFLTAKGFRIIIPDQLGWGKSDKPDIHYTFHLLATNTLALLDSLQTGKIILIGHSMGGMLAIRFSLLFPAKVEKMILEDPIGLEDYKTFVPYRKIEELYVGEKKATYESYKKYQQGYYPQWKPGYEQYVKAQAEELNKPEFDKTAWVNALTYDMIYQQPVVYELHYITVPVLLVTGDADRTIVGKDQLSETSKAAHGLYPVLARQANQQIPHSTWKELPGIGHIPHIQDTPLFVKTIDSFLN
jgi:pimeloyl-ACP methyl ester carboxylesterase